jgi:hypothetical protein
MSTISWRRSAPCGCRTSRRNSALPLMRVAVVMVVIVVVSGLGR